MTAIGQTPNSKVGWLADASFSNRETPLLGLFNDTWRTVTTSAR